MGTKSSHSGGPALIATTPTAPLSKALTTTALPLRNHALTP
ncbi:hypothetical protein [Streptomyces sp. NPDC047046]